MNGEVSDDFQSRCEIEEPFEQFVASYSIYRVILTSTSAVKFRQAPGTDVCSASYAAVMHVIGLLRNK